MITAMSGGSLRTRRIWQDRSNRPWGRRVARLLCLFGLLALPAVAAAQVPRAETTRLSKLLPEAAPVNATAEPAEFYASDLYRYIDGGAEAFHSYGLVAMVHRQYRPGEAQLTVDIYDLGNALNAFGIYASERSSESRFIPIGAEGYVDQNVLNFLQGGYYVKLAAFSDTAQPVVPLMRAFAGEISRRIGPGKRLPAALSLLPEKNRIPHSEKYFAKGPVGLELVGRALQASYSFEGRQSTLLIALAAKPDQARQRVESLKDYFIKTGKAASDALLPGAYRGSNPEQGEALFFARGRYAAVFIHPPAAAGDFLRDVAARLSAPGN